MLDPPHAGAAPAVKYVPVRALAKAGGLTPSHYYQLVAQQLAPQPHRLPGTYDGGVPIEQAEEWLRARAAEKKAKSDTAKRLRALFLRAAGDDGGGK